MSIFNETEEEKNYKKLVKAVRSSDSFNTEWQDYLLDYIDDVFYGDDKNIFFEFDYLSRFVLSLEESNAIDSKSPEDYMKEVKFILRTFLPLGAESEDFRGIMEMFLNNYCGENGFIDNNLVNQNFCALFQNRYDYLYIMNLISNDPELVENFWLIADYAIDVSPYCVNQSVLKNEILAFINGLGKEYGDLDEYRKYMLNEAKKRCGVYPIDEHSLARLAAETQRAQSLIAKLDTIEKKVGNYQDKVNAATRVGKTEIDSAVKSGKRSITELKDNILSDMNELLANSKAEIIEELDGYILTLEASLKTSSDQVFNKILNDSKEELRKIRRTVTSLSQTTTSELLRIQEATEESVSKLREYVDTEPQLQAMLESANKDEKIRGALLKLSEQQKEYEALVEAQSSQELQGTHNPQSSLVGVNSNQIVQTPSIIIPGYDRPVIPANKHVVIPSGEVSRNVLPAFDESIPFEVRMERILKVKEERMAKGEIFHEKMDEIIAGILEYDWLNLWGPSGCGKSYTVKQAARLIGIDMIKGGKITDKYSVMAYNDPQGRFRATQTFVATMYGKLLFLDEFDNGNTDTQVVLNELYSGLLDAHEDLDTPSYITFAEDMTIPIHPNFRIISAGNTSGEGEDEAYSSRGKSDEAVQQRMTPIEYWYDNRVEKRIFGKNEAWYNIFVNFRKICDDYAKRQGQRIPKGVVTTRDASAIVRYIGHNSKRLNHVLDQKFVQTKDPNYLRFISNSLKEMYDLGDNFQSNEARRLGDNREIDIAKRLVMRCDRKC